MSEPAAEEQATMPDAVAEQLPRVERTEHGTPLFVHACAYTDPDDGSRVRRTGLPLSRESGWWWEDDNTLKPSIHCLSCHTHGWWTAGAWEEV
jgi:hypothetical protein